VPHDKNLDSQKIVEEKVDNYLREQTRPKKKKTVVGSEHNQKSQGSSRRPEEQSKRS